MKKIIISSIMIMMATSLKADPNCPTLGESTTGKYVKTYVQYPENIGTSWRLYVRPRNGACLSPESGYQSPTMTDGVILKDGSEKKAWISPGSKNCNDDYKSYMPMDMPSAQSIYDYFMAYQTPVFAGFKILNTKNSGYKGAIALAPMKKSDGSYDRDNAMVVGVCYE